MELKISTAFHPQTDGQTERTNALLEMYLRHYVSANQWDWVQLLDQAQFSYNLQRSESTEKSPFEVITGQQPDTPRSIAADYMGLWLEAVDALMSQEIQICTLIADAYVCKRVRTQLGLNLVRGLDASLPPVWCSTADITHGD
ncbi:uncharacterized protein [Elaeis guineensis]|uniref:uncharacterized protein n=1 Tax=Elaeis guineensis var. tenera TaxID=51953 RepID=UPI003C6CFC0E